MKIAVALVACMACFTAGEAHAQRELAVAAFVGSGLSFGTGSADENASLATRAARLSWTSSSATGTPSVRTPCSAPRSAWRSTDASASRSYHEPASDEGAARSTSAPRSGCPSSWLRSRWSAARSRWDSASRSGADSHW